MEELKKDQLGQPDEQMDQAKVTIVLTNLETGEVNNYEAEGEGVLVAVRRRGDTSGNGDPRPSTQAGVLGTFNTNTMLLAIEALIKSCAEDNPIFMPLLLGRLVDKEDLAERLFDSE